MEEQEYDREKVVQQLTSSDPEVKQAGVDALNKRYEEIIAPFSADVKDDRSVIVTRTITVRTRTNVEAYANYPSGLSGKSGKGVQMTDDEIVRYEVEMDKHDAIEALYETTSYAGDASIDVACVVTFEETAVKE